MDVRCLDHREHGVLGAPARLPQRRDVVPGRTFGIANFIVPMRVSHVSSRCPLRNAVRSAVRSWRSAPINPATSVIRQRRLTQVAAATMLRIDQPKVSALLNGRLASFSSERLMRLLTRLGQNVEIVVKTTARYRQHGRIRVVEETHPWTGRQHETWFDESILVSDHADVFTPASQAAAGRGATHVSYGAWRKPRLRAGAREGAQSRLQRAIGTANLR